MFNLSQHLKTLLLEHNCVIIPDLGGFITQYVPAHFDTESQKFHAPSRKVAFNSALTMNDGLLVQSLMQTYDSTFPEMQKAMEDNVADIKERLFTEGFYDLPGIGRLTPNIEGQTKFEPANEGIMSPELFGLELIDAVPVAKGDSETNLTRGLIRREGNGYVVRIHRNIANAAAAAVCALFCYFNWTAPTSTDATQPNEAKLLTTEFFAADAQEQTKQDAKEAKLNDYYPNTAVQEEAKNVAEPASQSAAQPEPIVEAQQPFTVVLTQGLNKTLADNFVAKLQKAGLADGRAVNEGKYYAVYYGGFASAYEAQTFINTHKQHAEFEKAWAFKLP